MANNCLSIPAERSRRNIYLSGRRTSLGMENQLWMMLERIACEENISLDMLCTRIDEAKPVQISIHSLIRSVTLMTMEKMMPRRHNLALMEEVPVFPSPFHQALTEVKQPIRLLKRQQNRPRC